MIESPGGTADSHEDVDVYSEASVDSREACLASIEQGDWEVEIDGNGQDLKSMDGRGGFTDYFRIWGGTDYLHDCPTTDYSFNSLYFYGRQDNEVWQLAYELLSLFNGASELFKFKAHRPIIRGIKFRKRPLPFREPEQKLALLGRPPLRHDQWEKELSNASPTPRLRLLVLATENEDIYMMLKYLGFEASWSNYYKLLETMETHAKLKGKEIPGTKAERGRFTNNANNFSLVGYDARHGLKTLSDRQNTETAMSLQEAHAFITGRCKGYLNTVYPEYFKFS
jgi:hypothetical protein